MLTDPNADPHLFEPGTANGLAVARARVVIQNGLDYDSFMSRLERSAPSDNRTVVTISDVLGIHGQDADPHLWYDVMALPRIAAAIEQALAAADPRTRRVRKGRARLHREPRTASARGPAIAARASRRPVAYTEPVPGYLIRAAGLHNLAPPSFTRPIEEGTEPSASAVSAMAALATGTESACCSTTRRRSHPSLRESGTQRSAQASPSSRSPRPCRPGLTFQRWQLDQAHALQKALAPVSSRSSQSRRSACASATASCCAT